MEVNDILFKKIEYKGKLYNCNGVKTVNHKIVIMTQEQRTLVMFPSEFHEVKLISEKEKEEDITVRNNPEHDLNSSMILILESDKQSRRSTNQTKWTSFEDAILMERENAGVCRKAIATHMSRTFNAVNARVSYLKRLEEVTKKNTRKMSKEQKCFG